MNFEAMSLAELKQYAKEHNVKRATALRKSELIERLKEFTEESQSVQAASEDVQNVSQGEKIEKETENVVNEGTGSETKQSEPVSNGTLNNSIPRQTIRTYTADPRMDIKRTMPVQRRTNEGIGGYSSYSAYDRNGGYERNNGLGRNTEGSIYDRSKGYARYSAGNNFDRNNSYSRNNDMNAYSRINDNNGYVRNNDMNGYGRNNGYVNNYNRNNAYGRNVETSGYDRNNSFGRNNEVSGFDRNSGYIRNNDNPAFERNNFQRQNDISYTYERAASFEKHEAYDYQTDKNVEGTNEVNEITHERTFQDSGVIREGVFEVCPEGYGFIRCDNYLPGPDDVYVSPTQIRKFNLKTGDMVKGSLKVKNPNEKYQGLCLIKTINGLAPDDPQTRTKFENLTPIFPHERIHFETPECPLSMRLIDVVSPVGKGQRGMIVSQPKAGKTTLLKQMANAITVNHPEIKLIILLIDERPEEVTDIKESIKGDQVEVIYSTFDELAENHKRVSEMVIERAKRLVEMGHDVCILLDSITRLARAYNLTVTNSGRTLSGGLDPSALNMPKKFFGAARCMREGGSLTILATALVDTGSRMDDVVFEEFKGTGNMELVLDRSLSEKRIFPAIDLPKSGTRREDLLLTKDEREANYLIRTALNGSKSEEAIESVLNLFKTTTTNEELVRRIRTFGVFGKF